MQNKKNMLYYDIIIDYKKFRGKAVCEQQGVTNRKEFKESKEFKDKANDCTEDRLMHNAVKVTRERRHTPACSAVKGNLLKFPELIKLLTARPVPAAKVHGCLSRHSLWRRRMP